MSAHGSVVQFISTSHSGNAVYATSSASLSLYNGQVVPKSNDQYGVYANWADSLEIENFSYSNDFVGTQYRTPIYSYYLNFAFSLKDSILNSSSLYYYDYALDRQGYRSSASTMIENVTFIGDDNFGGFFRTNQNYGIVTFKDNTLFGGEARYAAVNINSGTALVSNNDISNITSKSSLIVLSVKSNLTAVNNSISHVKAKSSIVEVNGNSIDFKENKFLGVEGSAAIEINVDANQLDFTHNALIDPKVQFYVRTESQYDSTNEIMTIGANYWSANSFQNLNNRT